MIRLARTRTIRLDDSGFSFIELLAYMAIAALLILAAIPQFNQYREKADISNLQGDLKNAATSMEAEWQNTQSYPGAIPSYVKVSRGDTLSIPKLATDQAKMEALVAACDAYGWSCSADPSGAMSVTYRVPGGFSQTSIGAGNPFQAAGIDQSGFNAILTNAGLPLDFTTRAWSTAVDAFCIDGIAASAPEQPWSYSSTDGGVRKGSC